MTLRAFRCNFPATSSRLHHDVFTAPPAIVYSFAGGERRKWRRAQQLTKKRLFARTFSAAAGSAFRSLPFRHVREFPFRIGADRAKKRRKCRVQCINNSRGLLSSQSDATCSDRSPCHFQKLWRASDGQPDFNHSCLSRCLQKECSAVCFPSDSQAFENPFRHVSTSKRNESSGKCHLLFSQGRMFRFLLFLASYPGLLYIWRTEQGAITLCSVRRIMERKS